MKKLDVLLLFVLGLAVVATSAAFQAAPGYMDAEYYFAGGLSLAQGKGFTEPFLWNYLGNPAGLPAPSHAYWMPLASLLAAAGMGLTGAARFATARLGFALLGGLLPPLTAWLSWSLGGERSPGDRKRQARLAGLLAAFPAFYLPFLPTTDTFGVYMLLGTLALAAGSELMGGVFCPSAALWRRTTGVEHEEGSFAALRMTGGEEEERSSQAAREVTGEKKAKRVYLMAAGAGVLAGLMHLARADGLLWLGVGLLAAAWPVLDCLAQRRAPSPAMLRSMAALTGLCVLGYAVVMGPWMARNLGVFGKLLAPGGSRALWLTSYNDLYLYPASQLTPQRWWATGMGAIAGARLEALSLNLQTALAVQGEIFLAPLILIGLWRLRGDRRVQLGSLAWLLTLLAMTLVFPYPGGRGGFFHSGAAVQPLLWAAAPVGFEAVLEWASRRRGWNAPQARRVLGAGVVVLALFLSVIIPMSRPAQENQGRELRIDEKIQALGAAAGDVVMVNNPPGYYVTTGRMAIAIPYGDEGAAVTVGRRYGARFLLLEFNQLTGKDDLYVHPEAAQELKYLDTVDEVRIFIIP